MYFPKAAPPRARRRLSFGLVAAVPAALALVPADATAITGMLLDENSQLRLDHGFTQDDVDWEGHVTTPAGKGWILGFRPDLDVATVQGVVDVGVAGLAGGVVDPEQHLVSMGAVALGASDVDTWGTLEGIAALTNDAPAESTSYRVDPSTGRIGYTVVAPVPAATATLTDLLPFAVCNEVLPMEEPTGL